MKTKTKKSPKQPQKQKGNLAKNITIGVLAVLVFALGTTSVLFGMNMKTREEKEYLALYPTLLWRDVIEDCKMYRAENTYAECNIEEYGIADDGNPYVVFKRQDYNADPFEPLGKPYLEKMYFLKSQEREGKYSTLMDKEFKHEVDE